MICPACAYDSSLVVTKSWKSVLPLRWYSANELRYNTKNNHKYKKVRNLYIVKVGSLEIPPADTYRRVFFRRLYGRGPRGGNCRPFDKINYTSGGKPLLDALVWNGILVDDKPEYCDDYYLQQMPSSDGKHYIEIEVQEVTR